MSDQQRRRHHGEIRNHQEPVVHARQQLACGERAEYRAVPHSPARQQPVKRPERERQTLRLLQLHVRVMIDSKREECEDDSGDQRRTDPSGQHANEQGDANARHDESGKQNDVVHEQRTDTEPSQRRHDDGRQQERFGKCERAALGIKGVGVEEPRRRARQLVRHPRERPRVQQRIAVVVHAVPQMEHLRIRHQTRQRQVQQKRSDEKPAGAHVPRCAPCSISISSSSSSMVFVAA